MKRAIVSMALVASQAWAADTWTLADLEAAKKSGAYSEVLDRAENVPPAGRTDAWRAVVSEAAAVVIEEAKPQDTKLFSVPEKAAALAARHRFLDKAQRFVAAREKAVQAALAACLASDAADCLVKLEPYSAALSPQAALDAAKLVRKSYFAYAPMALVKQATSGQGALCKDEVAQEVTIAALGLPAGEPGAADARKVAFESCWAPMTPVLKKALVGASKYFLVNACKPMRAKKALSELQDDLCKDEEQ